MAQKNRDAERVFFKPFEKQRLNDYCWRFGTRTKTIDVFKIQYFFFHTSCFVTSKLMADIADVFLVRTLLAFLKNSVTSDQKKQMISEFFTNVSRVLRKLLSIALFCNILGIIKFVKEFRFLFLLPLGIISSQSDALS